MIKFENTEVVGWDAAIRGMRNPMNSWEMSDSCTQGSVWCNEFCGGRFKDDEICRCETGLRIGPNDLDLMKRLRNAGTDHRKFMRMITVYVDITAPLYWWKEFDTYKVGTVANSCSTMHKIAEKEFTIEDFSHEHLIGSGNLVDETNKVPIEFNPNLAAIDVFGNLCYYTPKKFMEMTCNVLNAYRDRYLETKDKTYWWQMIQLLPSSYNQRRTAMMNYEVLANIYKSRKNHKLDEWSDQNDFGFCTWIHSLPYSELITGDLLDNGPFGCYAPCLRNYDNPKEHCDSCELKVRFADMNKGE